MWRVAVRARDRAPGAVRSLPYDPVKSFAPVTLLASTRNALAATLALPVNHGAAGVNESQKNSSGGSLHCAEKSRRADSMTMGAPQA